MVSVTKTLFLYPDGMALRVEEQASRAPETLQARHEESAPPFDGGRRTAVVAAKIFLVAG